MSLPFDFSEPSFRASVWSIQELSQLHVAPLPSDPTEDTPIFHTAGAGRTYSAALSVCGPARPRAPIGAVGLLSDLGGANSVGSIPIGRQATQPFGLAKQP